MPLSGKHGKRLKRPVDEKEAEPLPSSGPDPCGEPLAGRLWPVLFLTLIFFLHFLARQLAGPMLPAMEQDLQIGHAVGGLFILFMGTGFFLSQLGAAFLTAWFGYRSCIILSLWGAAGAMCLIGVPGSVSTLFPAFFLLGLAGGLYVPSGIALISILIRPGDWGKSMGIHELAPNFALILAPFFATAILEIGSWRGGYLALAASLAVMGAVYARWGPGVPARGSVPDMRKIKDVAGNPAFWGLAGLISLAVGLETGVYAVLPLFLVNERSFVLASANRLLGLSRVPGLGIVLLSGWITDRLSPGTTLRLALLVSGLSLILLGMGPKGISVAAIFMQAAVAACLFPPILSAASGVSTPENRALTISLSLAVAPILGSGLVPAGIALAGDLGSFGMGLAAKGVVVLFGVLLIRLIETGQAGQTP
jgi:MFS transporter, NNP family, nitrate/nitrite transporter